MVGGIRGFQAQLKIVDVCWPQQQIRACMKTGRRLPDGECQFLEDRGRDRITRQNIKKIRCPGPVHFLQRWFLSWIPCRP